MMSCIIRPAGQGDSDTVVEIVRKAFADVAQRFNLTSENARSHPSHYTADRMGQDLDRGVVHFLLEKDGLPVGCVAQEFASPELCYLERLAVLPAEQNQGFGRRLVDHVLTNAGQLGARQVSIGVIAEQAELTDWYKRIGFVLTEKKTFPHLPFTVAFMIYTIS